MAGRLLLGLLLGQVNLTRAVQDDLEQGWLTLRLKGIKVSKSAIVEAGLKRVLSDLDSLARELSEGR